MRKLILILFCFSGLFSRAQEKETIYTDTIDLVDFFESVINNEDAFKSYWSNGKFKSFELKNSIITVKDSAFKFNIGLQLKQRFDKNANDTDMIIPHYIRIVGCKYLETQYGHYTLPFTVSNLNFASMISISRCKSIRPEVMQSTTTTLRILDCTFSDGIKITHFDSSKIYFRKNEVKNNITFIGFKESDILISDNRIDGGFMLTELQNFSLGTSIEIVNNTFVRSDMDTISIRENSTGFIHWKKNDSYTIRRGYFNPKLQQRPKSFYFDSIRSEMFKIGPTKWLNNGEQFYASNLIIKNNSFGNSINEYTAIGGEISNLQIANNSFLGKLIFRDLIITNELDCIENSFSNLIIRKVSFSEFTNRLPWRQFSNNKLEFECELFDLSRDSSYGQRNRLGIGDEFYRNAGHSWVYMDENIYGRSMETYSFLYENYKFLGDKESANGCYAEMKQVETRRWKYLYQQNKTFETFFRWQLNAFLSYFTDYGTNPAKAVIKSGWVILLFAIFYLFFPSDWDVSNRSQLLSKIKDLTSKNRDKSLLATLGFVLYSAFVHVLNALTLSLNAFTTLGFGEIPTHGAARYVTIVQGFIGWFLLTIFSVSLINQVLG